MLAIGSRFARVEPRRRAGAFLRGLLAGLPRANCWTIAEQAGQAGPPGAARAPSSGGGGRAGVSAGPRPYGRGAPVGPRASGVADRGGAAEEGGETPAGRAP